MAEGGTEGQKERGTEGERRILKQAFLGCLSGPLLSSLCLMTIFPLQREEGEKGQQQELLKSLASYSRAPGPTLGSERVLLRLSPHSVAPLSPLGSSA